MAYHFPGQDCDPDSSSDCEHGIRHIGDDLYDMSMPRPDYVPPVAPNCCRFYEDTYMGGSFEDFCTYSTYGKYLDIYEREVSSIYCGENADITVYQAGAPFTVYVGADTFKNQFQEEQPYFLKVNYVD